MRLLLIVLLTVSIAALSAATGNIAGKVISEETGEGATGIAVSLDGSGVGAMTNRNGGYIIKNVPVGNYTLSVRHIGHEPVDIPVTVLGGETIIVNITLEVKPLAIEGLTVSANRAVKRETPIAFSSLDEEELSNRYTTQDVPQLMDDVPGLFATSSGLGESEISMRGFDADKIQILINGIPVNDPESQQVYWSNWTGLASNVKNVQVQRGSGSSLYGSGAFGGSVNIETMGSSIDREIEVRTSVGTYVTDDKIADGRGGKESYNPVNYNVITRYRSGMLNDGKFNYSLMAERKGGDSYINGTNYDGWSFAIEAATLIGAHSLNYSLIGAPQKHNQARKVSDPMLYDALGREYNRNNTPTQENYYFKPQFSVRDEWTISETQKMMTNVFFTMGKGGGKYLYNDTFDGDLRFGNVPTGEIGYQPVDYSVDNRNFARHALWAYLNYGVVLDGFDPNYTDVNGTQNYTYMGWDPDTGDYTEEVTVRYDPNDGNPDQRVNLVTNTYDNSWVNDSQNDHVQFGINTYYQQEVSDMFTFTVGGELRRWMADHYAESEDFRCWNTAGTRADSVRVYSKVQRRYDYSSVVHNMSCFFRAQFSPIPKVMTIMCDVQYANYHSEIDENPIEIYDFRAGEWSGETFYATKNMLDEDGNRMFSDDDYQKTFKFLSPKAGVNYNLTQHFNVLSNYSIAYKEPRTYEWYDRTDGPNQGQVYEEDGHERVKKLKPEKAETIEFGIGYTGVIFDASVNYYITDYTDKIESVDDEQYGSITMNAGRARHQGWEISGNAAWDNWDASASVTLSQNRWLAMDVEQIFHASASEIEGRVVPFSPEKMANAGVGYTFRRLPMQGKMRVGLSSRWWDDYYGTYTNKYTRPVYYEESVGEEEVSSKLPHFFELNMDFKYDFVLGGKEMGLKLDLNNITDRDENYSSASESADYGTNNAAVNGKYLMYVSPSPRFNVFLTAEVKF